MMHICCAPCLLAPLSVLRQEGIGFSGVFINPNIHPYREYMKRRTALETLQEREREKLDIDFIGGYGLESFLGLVAPGGVPVSKAERCHRCWELRLRGAAKHAREKKFDVFSSTLLASPMQNHDIIREIGETVAAEEGIGFYYRDFRGAFAEAQEKAKKMSLYRQQYCGCIFSEQERFDKSFNHGR